MLDALSEVSFRANAWALPYFLSTTLAGVMVLLVYLRGRGELRRPFMGLVGAVSLTMCATGVLLLAADAQGAFVLVRVSQAVALWISPAAVEFARALTHRRLDALRRLSVGAALLLTVVDLATPWVIGSTRVYPFGFAGDAGPLYPLAMAEMGLTLCVPVLVAHQLAQEHRPLERRQLYLVMISATASALGFIDLLPVLGLSAPPFGWMPLLGGALVLLWAIVGYRLLDVRLAARRAGLWLALTLVGGLPFAVLATTLGTRLARRPLPSALLYAALVLLMRAYLITIHPRLERLVGRRRRDLDAEMATLTAQAATLQTTEQLGYTVDRFLAALDRRLAALVVIDASGRPRVALSAWGSVPAPTRGSPLLVELARARALVWREAAQGPARLEIERACVRWGAEYLGPLVEGEELLGLIAIGPKQGGVLADALELEALDRMCVVVTGALAGARLYERLRALSTELEQKAAARSASLAKTLEDLRGAEARLVQSEKLASLGQIVAGVAADLGEQVDIVFAEAGRVREQALVLAGAAEKVKAQYWDERLDEIARDVGPIIVAIREGARRAHAIAEDLEHFAPTGAPQGPSRERQPAHLAALLDRTLTLVTSHLRDVAVVRDYDESLPPLPVEVGPLGQVILNLILNATQAMRGSGTLTLSTRRGPDHAELAVADTGPGIPPDVLPRIFEPFFSTKGPTAGTGLGLSVSYSIVERHGGQIFVDSTVGKGSTFRVRLPIVPASAT
jgi:signal transduction histidine kinase